MPSHVSLKRWPDLDFSGQLLVGGHDTHNSGLSPQVLLTTVGYHRRYSRPQWATATCTQWTTITGTYFIPSKLPEATISDTKKVLTFVIRLESI